MCGQLFDLLVGPQLKQLQFHSGKCASVLTQHRRHDPVDSCLKGADAQMAEVTARRAPSRSKRPLAVGESQRRLLVERVSGVGEFDGRRDRSMSSTPSWCSSLRICWLSGGCARCRRSAARPK